MEPARVADAVEATGSLVAAIDSLLSDGRSLVPYVPDEVNAIEEVLAENDLFDPERPPSLMARIRQGIGMRKSPWR